MVSGRLACTSSKTEIFKQNRNLDFNPEFSITYRMFLHPKNLKSENNNPWFKPWFDILLHTVDSQCFRVLGIYTGLHGVEYHIRWTNCADDKAFTVTCTDME